MKFFLRLVGAFALFLPTAAVAAGDFILVNGTGEQMHSVMIRRHGTNGWSALTPPPQPGRALPVRFADVDCAFDIQAVLASSGPTLWAGVNLCDVERIVLRNGATAGPWVDYDAP